MTNRRFFLVQGTLATTAMFALNPFTSIGRAVSQFTELNGSYGKLAFLHTANRNALSNYTVIQYINGVKSNNKNVILLKAEQDIQDENGSLSYDASINGSSALSTITGNYKIIYKGNIKTGIICAMPGESDVIQKINSLSAYLKKEKSCTLVVCLSQLGYKNKNTPDDITLANKSTYLDIIIGGHAENFPTHPIVALNSNNGEVIIHSSSGHSFDFGKIEIDFDAQGRKKHISFANHS